MTRLSTLFLLVSLVVIPVANAQSLGETTRGWEAQSEGKELTFLAFYFSRAEYSNIYPKNGLQNGQLIGRLFGPNSTTTSAEDRSQFVEQRIIPFFIYEPRILNGFALLRASFELDWTWGDTAYSTGGNFGGALSGDQVNLQTQNVQIEFRLHPKWYLDVGLQRLYDNPRDLYRTFFSTLSLTGQRMAFWGTDGVGAVLHGTYGHQKFKFGAYQLYENLVQKNDDVSLFEGVVDRYLVGTWHVSANVRYLRDRANGAGGVSILGEGLNSNLTDFNGVYRFLLEKTPYQADVFWLGLDASFNPELQAGRFGGSGFVVANLGEVRTMTDDSMVALDADEIEHVSDGVYEHLAGIRGLAANARAAWKYGRTPNDYISLEGIYTSGEPYHPDKNELNADDEKKWEDDTYSGVITGNTWGAPAGAFTSSGLYLLLPHINVVNRYYSAVCDISNMGYGLTAGVVNVSRDLVRNQLRLKLGAGAGLSNVVPEDGYDESLEGKTLGYELNAMLTYQPKAFFTIGLHTAKLWLGDFFDSAAVIGTETTEDGATVPLARPVNPWTTFVTLSWLMF